MMLRGKLGERQWLNILFGLERIEAGRGKTWEKLLRAPGYFVKKGKFG
jgi:hypothetical protein